jgi:hypothetical protein
VGFGDGTGRLKCRGAINTSKPGLYTVDTHAIHEVFRQGKQKQCFLSVYTGGSSRRPDGTVQPGLQFTFDWLRLSPRPCDGLVVTLADGTPLPEKLKAGDELLFRLFLAKPAVDAVVEVFVDAHYAPFMINGEPYVQLVRTGSPSDGREWAATVKLNARTGKYRAGGYPVLMRAVVTGGSIRETYASPFLTFE